MIHEKTFRERLTLLIGNRGNRSFASDTGVNTENIRNYLRGDVLPTQKILKKIADANKVSICWLIGEDEEFVERSTTHPHYQNKSMQEMAQWISAQNDGINYWEVAKAKMAQDFPEFKEWLKTCYLEEKETPHMKLIDRK